jgi:copper transport protein
MSLRTSIGRAAAATVVIAATLGLSAGTALAHVEVVRTDPADGSVLATSPAAVTLSFTDELDVDLANVRLTTASGTEIELGAMTLGSDGSQLVVALPTLASDAYRLSYDVRDPIDLHETSGSVVFGVGTLPVIGGGIDSRGAQLGDSAFGWLARGGLALVIGGVAMIIILRLRSRDAVNRGHLVATSISVARRGGIALLIGEVGMLASQIVDIGESPTSTAWRVLVRSSFGHRFLISAVLVLGLLRFLTIVRPLLLGSAESRLGLAEVGSAVVAAALLVVAAFASHAGIGGAFALGVVLRIGHLGGMGVWVGGLVVLVVARRRFGAIACGDLLRSFSLVALLCVAITIATGLLLAGREVTSLTALFTTGFGDVLVVKVVLLGVALVLGARHASAVRRGRVVRPITLAVEAAVALVIVLGGAALATAAPAVGRRFEPAAEMFPTNASDKTDDLLIRLTIGPSRPGRNLVRVEFIDSRRPAPASPESVTVEMTNASGELVSRSGGPPVGGIIDLAPADITAPGPLRITVRPERSSRPIPPVTFDWTIGPTPVQRSETVLSDRQLSPFTQAGAGAVAVATVAVVWPRRRRNRARKSGSRSANTLGEKAATHRDPESNGGDRSFGPIETAFLFNPEAPWHDDPRRGATERRTSDGQSHRSGRITTGGVNADRR